MASIVVVTGSSRGTCFKLPQGSTVVGRGEDCDVQVLDEQVSRRHLEISFDAEQDSYVASDVESANGTLLAGQRMTEARLHDGDLLEIGDSKILYTDRDFPDQDEALAYFKMRGERGKSTMVRRPEDPEPWVSS